MPADTLEYHFGRLNLIATYEDKAEFLFDTLNRPVQEQSRGYEWGIFQVDRLTYLDRTFLHGLLVKFKPTEEDVVDEATHSLGKAYVPNKAKAKSEFFLEARSGVVAFHPVAGIGHHRFKSMFSRLIEKSNEDMLIEAEIRSIDPPEGIIEAIRRFDQIRYVSISLHPSNPNLREVWRKTDERLKRVGAKRFRETYTGDNLQVVDDPDVMGDIMMAGDGYGHAEVRGIRDGQTMVASTDEVAVTQQVPRDAEGEGIIAALWNQFCKIWKRV